MVGDVRDEENALFVCHIPDGRPKRKGILLELDHSAVIRRNLVIFGDGDWHGGLRGSFSSLRIERIDVDRAGT